jgi:hypothetical protein
MELKHIVITLIALYILCSYAVSVTISKKEQISTSKIDSEAERKHKKAHANTEVTSQVQAIHRLPIKLKHKLKIKLKLKKQQPIKLRFFRVLSALISKCRLNPK